MTFAFEEWKEELTEALRADFKALSKRIAGETLYAAALVTDSHAGSVYLGVHTEEALRRRIDYCKNEVGIDTPSIAAALRWTPDEWEYSDGDLAEGKMPQVSRRLFDREDYSIESQAAFYETASEALRRLDDEELFGTGAAREAVTLFLSVTDDDRTDEVENYSAKLLNPEAVYRRFLGRFDGIGG
ncbi:DUF4303 domain-containing protein [Saccharibacillus alkalitolerans]|uniref:DUF4303 domain-containing protein n=1 Tax=Saccharibacillus alkalitolerans TaxID=2705290 RepID=A0ABX0FCF9_9BACL|nr:DUF4303 domain-containing protein [Saccharibacillus alkalitolerans]NGZ77715.1 DUF4303 domain-containing protein [Saccharibacillus alkalitolerans]